MSPRTQQGFELIDNTYDSVDRFGLPRVQAGSGSNKRQHRKEPTQMNGTAIPKGRQSMTFTHMTSSNFDDDEDYDDIYKKRYRKRPNDRR